MTGTDAEIIRNIRREIGRRPLDATRLDIQVVNGKVTMCGTLAHLRTHPNVSLESEMELLQKMIMRERQVHEFFNQVHYAKQHDHTQEDAATRGRLRR